MLSPNLYQAIILFCKLARSELTSSDFQLRQQQDLAWFCGGTSQGTDDEIQQVDLYRLGMMIQVIRAAIGMDWQPRELQLQSQNEKSVRNTELIRNANVRFGCKMSAVGLPYHALALTLQNKKDQIPAVKADSGLTLPPESEMSVEYTIKEIIRTHIRSRKGRIQQVAKSLDLSVRTLQRRLSENGLSFSQLIQQTRLETAQMMLRNTETKIIEIAMEIGYKEASHFTRAFQRNTGLTPYQYRFYHQSANLKSKTVF